MSERQKRNLRYHRWKLLYELTGDAKTADELLIKTDTMNFKEYFEFIQNLTSWDA